MVTLWGMQTVMDVLSSGRVFLFTVMQTVRDAFELLLDVVGRLMPISSHNNGILKTIRSENIREHSRVLEQTSQIREYLRFSRTRETPECV